MRFRSERSFFKIEDLYCSFGGVAAVCNVSLQVEEGEIHGLIGPNGAGKTTILNLISGLQKPDKGNIFFKEYELTKYKPFQISRMGIGRTFQNVELFSRMTVLENVMVGMHTFIKNGFFSSAFGMKRARSGEREAEERSVEILKFLDLHHYCSSAAMDLPFGQQRLLELGRALASHPRLLLLDEPAAGMNPSEIRSLGDLLQTIQNQWGVTILLVEHVMKLVMELSDRMTVLNFGEKIAEGTPEEVKANPKVIEAYLGKERRVARS